MVMILKGISVLHIYLEKKSLVLEELFLTGFVYVLIFPFFPSNSVIIRFLHEIMKLLHMQTHKHMQI